MRKILLPIKPQFVGAIIQGKKTVEYRSWKPNCPCPFQVLVYSSSPVCEIVGEFIVNNIMEGTKEEIWRYTKSIGGISEECFKKYFNNKKKCYAFEISDFREYQLKKTLSDYNISNVPQRFCYIL